MNVYDTANRLAFEIKSSPEYQNYRKMKEKVKEEAELSKKLDEFEKAQYEVQIASLSGEEPDKEKTLNLQKIYAELITNDIMKQYFDAELKFNVILADVNKIIAEAVSDLIK